MVVLDNIIGTDEAALLWGCHADHVKRLCRTGKVICKRIGKTYILLKDQPNPLQPKVTH